MKFLLVIIPWVTMCGRPDVGSVGGYCPEKVQCRGRVSESVCDNVMVAKPWTLKPGMTGCLLALLRMYGKSACPRFGIQYNYRSTIAYFFCLHNEKILSSIVNKRFIEIKGIIWYNQVADMKIMQKEKQ